MGTVRIKELPTPERYDHIRISFDLGGHSAGSGYISKNDPSAIGLMRCPICQGENYGPMVSAGICAWCKFDVHQINEAT